MLSTAPIMPQLTIRPIQEQDWPAILALQAEAYYAVEPESEAVLKSKTTLGPETCLVACRGAQILGYCLAHPWEARQPAALYRCYPHPAGEESLYIHDVVVSPAAQGLGIARRFVEQTLNCARKNRRRQLSLVAVQGADRYWARYGFQPAAANKDLSEYGEQAVYMRRPLEKALCDPTG